LLLGYLIGSFQNFLEQILTHSLFVRYSGWFEAFPYLHVRDADVGPFESRVLTHYSGGWVSLWKQNTLHFAVVVVTHFKAVYTSTFQWL